MRDDNESEFGSLLFAAIILTKLWGNIILTRIHAGNERNLLEIPYYFELNDYN